ncbi:MAG: LPXTG cell wall anchor domain-containing protein [Candidatus Saccharibacteria bacterium]
MESITQTINIVIGGEAGGNLANTGANTTLYTAIGVSLIAVAVLFLFSRMPRVRTKLRKLSFRSIATFAFLSVATIGLGLNLSSVSAAPTLSLGANQDTLTVTVPEGGGTATTTTAITTGTTNPTGYSLTAALTEAEPGIAIKLKGGNITTSTALEPGAPALTLKTTDSASSNDTTEVTLDFTIDSTVTAGQKELKLTYSATDNETPLPPTPTTMQEMTTSYCENYMTIYNGSNQDAILTLTDTRANNQTYEVAKLADGNCWMLNNLKLGSTTSTLELTPADTNIASNFTLPQVVTTGTADYDNPGAYGPAPGDTGAGETNYGYLYNWSAATAGESRTSMPAGSGNAPYSICPANWRLPTGGSGGEFAALYTALGSSPAQWNYPGPFQGTFAGVWWEGFYGQGDYGDLWSASAFPVDASSAFGADFSAGSVVPGGGVDRDGGLSVRCLLH